MVIPEVIRLVTLADVRELIEPASADAFRDKATWRVVAKDLGQRHSSPTRRKWPGRCVSRFQWKAIDAVRRALDHGRRAYWVCPLVARPKRLNVPACRSPQ